MITMLNEKVRRNPQRHARATTALIWMPATAWASSSYGFKIGQSDVAGYLVQAASNSTLIRKIVGMSN
jgi:hypothetical protein